jgi:hypothetical protein
VCVCVCVEANKYLLLQLLTSLSPTGQQEVGPRMVSRPCRVSFRLLLQLIHTPLTLSSLSRERTRRRCTVFISFRLGETLREAQKLRDALEDVGVSTYLCETLPGDNLLTEISHAMDDCELAVIMGSETFGEKTGSTCSTLQELQFIIDEEKPFVLIKMCDRFKHPETRVLLPKSCLHIEWKPRTPMPEDLVDSILDKIAFGRRNP